MSALVLALALLSGVAAAGPAQDVWITVDQDVLAAFERGGEKWEATPNEVADPAAPRGQVVAVALSEERIDALASFIHERYRRCAGFVAHANQDEAMAVAARAGHSETLERTPPRVPYTIDNGNVARALGAEVTEIGIRNTITSLSSFLTRRHNCATGYQSALWIRDLWQLYAAGRTDVTVELFSHEAAPVATPQPSVILTIQGTTLPSEVVVMGGHQDSINGSSCNNSAPGADDDASGIATLSEVIRAAMALGYQPQRTVKFMAYAAEEVGLRGSNHIAQTYADQGVNVVGVLQLDMTNYRGTPGADIVFYTDFTNVAQTAFLRSLADTYIDGATAYTPRLPSACGYGCSDHAAWHNRGFATSFPFEAVFGQHNNEIHSTDDTLKFTGGNAHNSMPFAKLTAAYMAEVAKGGFTARPAVAGATKGGVR